MAPANAISQARSTAPPPEEPVAAAGGAGGATVIDAALVAVAPLLSVMASCTVTLPAELVLSVATARLVAPLKLANDAPAVMVHW